MWRNALLVVNLCVFGFVAGKSFPEVNGGWHIHVTLHVFSGRVDPTWTIPYSHVDYKEIIQLMGTKPDSRLFSRLGYKGFTLVHVPPGHFVTSGSHYNATVTSYPELEMKILMTSLEKKEESGIDEYIIDHTKQAILESRRHRRSSNNLYDSLYPDYGYGDLLFRPSTADPLNLLTDNDMYKLIKLLGDDKRLLNKSTTPPPSGPTQFDPLKWNKYFVKDHNNCYNYANNKITDTFAQPGRAGSCEIGTHPTGNDFKRAALCDGLKEILTPRDVPVPDSGWNLVALVFWPPKPGSMLFDFHWYRLDGNSRWSHKPGRTVATNVDDSKKAIRDPRTADRGPYTEFVAFLETRQDKVLLI
ncbi:uncharacterized protein LOC128206139 isoform X1 [Mya arenaria]|uniref:uncharacterized protein LOC128206139 isoform X1 n=1 Tax=Mya arenaria TaxID=6604 RepID=UPI0022E0CCCF|nr:uncharacterized protein LOC128206139 isoform X1 [Mya arenaria]